MASLPLLLAYTYEFFYNELRRIFETRLLMLLHDILMPEIDDHVIFHEMAEKEESSQGPHF